MLSYLRGRVDQIQRRSPNRVTLILEVNGLGYEIQVTRQLADGISEDRNTELQVFTHFMIREEQPLLYGFASAAERDLFRQLVGVSGIGAQLAIALLDTLGLSDLVQAIVTGNIKQLVRTPGVGSKTAERISLELRTKLSQWRGASGVALPASSALPSALQEDVEMTLMALGYNQEEIAQALGALSQKPHLMKTQEAEDWIREAISWLS
ncbi:Holliday junction branch migration protein RuvA [Roseofilum sp. BLCC_M154]|uniref:Holliday junction branch migration complex subunit RuvA n=1 Tax=Roseofilum acuticapitatum BLCC-M154 TaxID=3022444 RepID=A0ABT7AU01_9CYAN|nr:Holliday junction branch migration protein RuvA [Roseofilum acuticapitatum]MDJ1169553.1 Holliday junction branch migration protein RuvA [Roseofilum acuticapitatum BLCC-M154]